jgi:hypothetical protein
MHLAHPALTTTGKKKGKKKWASAEHKRRAEMAQTMKANLYSEYNITPQKRNKKGFTAPTYKPNYDHPRYERDDSTRNIKSLESTWATCAKPVDRKYTGERQLIGIAVMHKSNLVPIFADNKEVAIDIARMRR